MNYDNELWDSIKVCNPNTALYIVGEHVNNGRIQILENTWIYTLAYLGSFINFNYNKWLSTCKDVISIIKKNEFHISDAFEITIKLCLLFKHSHMYINPPKLDIRTLRKKIVNLFNDDIKLSNKGLKQFESFLPKDTEEREFCVKIISGLISLWVEKKHQEFRNSLEYIDRKKYEIEIPSNIHLEWGDQHYPMNIILWECLCKLEPSYEVLKELYNHNYVRRNHKIHVAFLLATSSFLYSNTNSEWSEKEISIIHNVIDNSKNIYKQIDTEDTASGNNNDILAFENFYPTIDDSRRYESYYEDEYNNDNKRDKNKTIVINKKSKNN